MAHLRHLDREREEKGLPNRRSLEAACSISASRDGGVSTCSA